MKPIWLWTLMGAVIGLAFGSTLMLIIILVTGVVPSAGLLKWLWLIVMAIGMGGLSSEMVYGDLKLRQRGKEHEGG